MLIIAIILLNFIGCGYKRPPYYEEKLDENVTLILHTTKSEAQ